MKEKKKGYFGRHSKSSAALVSIAVHAVLIVAAVTFVAFRVSIKEDKKFEPKPVNRPRMKLKKLQVPVKETRRKKPKPKLRKTIVVKRPVKTVDIKMPEMVGVKGGTGYLNAGEGLGGIGFGLDMDLFGGSKGTGNELEGTFFDLKMDPDRRRHKMGNKEYKDALKNFIGSWNLNRLEKRFFKAPKKKFATTFILPRMDANEAPKAYNVDKVVKPKYWAAYYKGMIAAPETGKYRFWGAADDLLIVRVKGDMVLDGTRKGTIITNWKSDDPRSGKFKVSGEEIKIGEWFRLKKGDAVEMEVLIGERPGGLFNCTLLVEQEGVDYPKGKGGRPVLPIFKTKPIPKKIVRQMKIEPGTCSPDGPTFGVMK